jgi:hypothetical protein
MEMVLSKFLSMNNDVGMYLWYKSKINAKKEWHTATKPLKENIYARS